MIKISSYTCTVYALPVMELFHKKIMIIEPNEFFGTAKFQDGTNVSVISFHLEKREYSVFIFASTFALS